jgi:hypothetical protein
VADAHGTVLEHLYRDPGRHAFAFQVLVLHTMKTRLKEAMRGSWEKLHTMLTGMSEKLTEVDEDTKKRWHDSFVTNARDMCRMLTHLNITKDPELEKARRALEQVMAGADIDVIKDNPMVRESMKTKVDSILKQFEW